MTPDMWTKSTVSQDNGACVEVIWRKSSFSGPFTDNCVEVGVWATSTSSSLTESCVEVSGSEQDTVLVRDTKDRDGGTLSFTRAEWVAFLAGAKDGEFDLA